jgi:hypothetical protein
MLPENMCLLAACNPYKLRDRKMLDDSIVGLAKKQSLRTINSKLAYHVNALPNNVVEYVWDFGALTPDDYVKYVDQMLTHQFFKKHHRSPAQGKE